MYYFGIGGDVSEFEVDAYLHHSMVLPRLQRDLLAHAANEIIAEIAPPRAPLTSDIIRSENAAAACSGRDEHASFAGDCGLLDRGEPEVFDE